MPRGPGRLTKGILNCLSDGREWTATDLAESVLGSTSAAAAVSVRRALRALAASGQAAAADLGTVKLWRLAAAEKRRKARERKRAKEQARDREVREEEARRDAEFDAQFFGGKYRPPQGGSRVREQLVKVLGMLGSNQDGEVLSAARRAERIRRKMGKGWDDLVSRLFVEDGSGGGQHDDDERA